MADNKLALIGRGCNSEVYAYGHDQNRVVLKVVSSLNKKEQTHLKNQFLILDSLDHQNIIKTLRYQQNVAFQGNKMDKQLKDTKSIMVLEYAQKGSFLNFIQKNQLDLNTKRSFFREIASGISYLHSQNIAHRDLKLQNLLVFSENGQISIKISDFGFASSFKKQGELISFSQYRGTRKGYMAPEIHLCQTEKISYDASKCDIFALGVILFALIVGKLPFQFAVQDNKLYKTIKDKRYEQFWNFHQIVKLEESIRLQQFKQLFERMVSFQPSERPTIKQILNSTWII